MKRYEAYAAQIAEMIATGALKPGDRIPTVRDAGRQQGISPATVFRAYYLLESRGLIVARPRSGYYVSALPERVPPPVVSQPLQQSTAVEKADLIYEVLGAAKQPQIVPLGSAFPSVRLFPLDKLARSVSRGMRAFDPGRVVADLSPGNAELRRLIALRYRIDGLRVSADEIVVTDGAMEALNLCLLAVTKPGDAVILESPTFYGALQALERLHLRAIEIPTDPLSGIDLQALATVLRRQRPAACWLMPSFQNPLGSLMPESRKAELVQLLAEHEVPLIEDDVYGDLYYAAQRPRPAKAFDQQGLVLHCSSFSKSLAPGYRIGWVAPGRYVRQLQRLKLGTTLSAAMPSQVALADYLSGSGFDPHLRRLRERLAEQRDAMAAAVAEFFPKGTRATRPEGGYFMWLELPRNIDTLSLHRQALRKGISIAPGALFSARNDFAHCLRLNYGHPDDRRVNRALRTLGQLAAALQR